MWRAREGGWRCSCGHLFGSGLEDRFRDGPSIDGLAVLIEIPVDPGFAAVEMDEVERAVRVPGFGRVAVGGMFVA